MAAKKKAAKKKATKDEPESAIDAAVEAAIAPPELVVPEAFEPASEVAKAFEAPVYDHAVIFNPGSHLVVGDHAVPAGETVVSPAFADLIVGPGDAGAGLASKCGVVRLYPSGHPKAVLNDGARARGAALHEKFSAANAGNVSNSSLLRRRR